MSTDTPRRYITSIHFQYSGGANQLRPAYRFDIASNDKGEGGGFRVFRPACLPTPTPRST